jgi:hypothetical protein
MTRGRYGGVGHALLWHRSGGLDLSTPPLEAESGEVTTFATRKSRRPGYQCRWGFLVSRSMHTYHTVYATCDTSAMHIRICPGLYAPYGLCLPLSHVIYYLVYPLRCGNRSTTQRAVIHLSDVNIYCSYLASGIDISFFSHSLVVQTLTFAKRPLLTLLLVFLQCVSLTPPKAGKVDEDKQNLTFFKPSH